jgi:hypothetical protein
MPGRITPVVVLHNLGRILDDLTTKEAVFVAEVHPNQLARVEQPVIMMGQLGLLRFVASDVTDIFPRVTRELCRAERRVLEGAEQSIEVVPDEQAQRSSSCS